jgi:hypothetical protein
MTNAIDLMSMQALLPMRSSYISNIVIEVPRNETIIHKIGKVTGKIVRFFRKPQTRATAMLSYWGVETVLFSIIMLTASSSIVFASALFLYLYGTYALFSAINVLTK